jgi:CRP/FNR family cyclic AMP-dependent transcriptional regulator
VFLVSWYPLETLEEKVNHSDFAIAIVTPDDETKSRDEATPSPRDNVVFELGLFTGRIGRKRSFLLQPCGEEIKLPSDVTGITTIKYKHSGGKLASALGPATNQMREIILDLGPNN